MILQGESYEFGTVFQTVAFFMFVIPRLRPGLLSLRSVLSSRQVLLVVGCWYYTEINWQVYLYSNRKPTTDNQQPFLYIFIY